MSSVLRETTISSLTYSPPLVSKPVVPQLITMLESHSEDVTCCAWSPCGKIIATGSKVRAGVSHPRYCSSQTKCELAWVGRSFEAISAFVRRASVSHTDWSLAPSQDTTCKLFDASSGMQQCVLTHTAAVTCCAFGPSEAKQSVIATGCSDRTVALWDCVSGTRLREFAGHRGPVRACAFAPRLVDGALLLASGGGDFDSGDFSVIVWDAGSGALQHRLPPHGSPVTGCAFSPSGSLLVSSSGKTFDWPHVYPPVGEDDNTVRVYDVPSGQLLCALRGHWRALSACAFSPDESTVLSCSWDGSVKLWDVNIASEAQGFCGNFEFERHFMHEDELKKVHGLNPTFKEWQRDAAFTFEDSEYRKTVDGCERGVVYRTPEGGGGEGPGDIVWRDPCVATIAAHTASASFCGFGGPRGSKLVTGGEDRTLKVWDADAALLSRTVRGHLEYIASVAVSPDGRRILTVSPDRTARLWDAVSCREVLTMRDHWSSATDCAFGPDGKVLASVSDDRTAKFWDASNGTLLSTHNGHSSTVVCIDWDHVSNRVVTGGYDNSVMMWDASDGMQLLDSLQLGGGVLRCKFVPEKGGSLVLAVTSDTYHVWDTTNTSGVRTFGGLGVPLQACCFAGTDNSTLLGTSLDGKVRLWDFWKGVVLWECSAHSDAFHSCFWLTSNLFSTSSRDGTVRLWRRNSSIAGAAVTCEALGTFYETGPVVAAGPLAPRGKSALPSDEEASGKLIAFTFRHDGTAMLTLDFSKLLL